MSKLGSFSLASAIVYCFVAFAVSAEEPQSDLVNLAIGLFAETDKDLRALGFDQVRTEAKGTTATKAFAAQLSKLPADAQIGLLSALADRGDSAARPAVLEVLAGKSSAPVRVAAIAALGKLGETADVELLVAQVAADSSHKESAEFQSAARGSLISLPGSDTPTAIATAMKSASPAVRVTLIEILAARRAQGAFPALLEAAVDADPAVRTAAMLALGQFAGPPQLERMAAGILNAQPGSERDAAERAVALVCSRIADTQQRAASWLSILATAKPSDRLILLPTLGRIGTPAALKLIEDEMASSNSQRTTAGLRALCNWPDGSVAPQLFKQAKQNSHAEDRALALSALIRIAPMNDGRPDAERLAATKQVMELCRSADDQNRLLKRASNVRMVETLQFVLPYLDLPDNAQQACETIVEMAHHRGLREPNKVQFDAALDKVIATSNDPVVLDRAQRYKKDQTWVRPTAKE